MFTLANIERQFDGAIPRIARAVAPCESSEMVDLVRARGELAFLRSMVGWQIKVIRSRRADGSVYPALINDLQFYRQHFRKWHQCATDAATLSKSTTPLTSTKRSRSQPTRVEQA